MHTNGDFFGAASELDQTSLGSVVLMVVLLQLMLKLDPISETLQMLVVVLLVLLVRTLTECLGQTNFS